jgi:hypothetical protein
MAVKTETNDLLKEVINNAGLIDWCLEYHDKDDNARKLWDAIKRARAAILKAEGK